MGEIIDGWLFSYLYEGIVGQVMVCRKEIEGDAEYRYHIEFLSELQDWNAINFDTEKSFIENLEWMTDGFISARGIA